MTKIVKFAHSLGDTVKITGLEGFPARIDQMAVTSEGLIYRVVYWFNGEQKTAWVSGDEIR